MFRVLDRVLDTLLVVVLAAMAAIVAANVFCRFVLNFSLYWGDEAAQSLLVWLTFLGGAVAVRERAHYAFDSLARSLREPLRLVVGVLSRVLTIVALLGLFYWGVRVTWQIRPWIMPAMGVSRAWVYLAGPVGSLFMLLYAVEELTRFARGPRRPSAAAPSSASPATAAPPGSGVAADGGTAFVANRPAES